MLPWAHGFVWDTGHLFFLGLFYSVILVILATLAAALLKTRKVFQLQRQEAIRWETDFEDLPPAARICRHELTGEVTHRTCDNQFDCNACPTHAKLLARQRGAAGTAPPEAGEDETPLGLNMPADRWYHRGHTWARREADGTFTIGLDDFGAHLLGQPDQVLLPEVGETLHANGTGWHFLKHGQEIRLLSPVSGKVIARGGPAQGWYLRLQPNHHSHKLGHLLKGEEIRPWLLRELERLQLVLAPEGVGASLADGGVLCEDLMQSYPEANWDAILGEVFLES